MCANLGRKKIRLAKEAYAKGVFLLTICGHGEAPIFANRRLRDICADSIRRKAGEERILVWCYCIMPGHVHLVVQPADPANKLAG